MSTKTGIRRLTADAFVDASGDADLATTVGVPFERGGGKKQQAVTCMFRMSHVEREPFERFMEEKINVDGKTPWTFDNAPLRASHKYWTPWKAFPEHAHRFARQFGIYRPDRRRPAEPHGSAEPQALSRGLPVLQHPDRLGDDGRAGDARPGTILDLLPPHPVGGALLMSDTSRVSSRAPWMAALRVVAMVVVGAIVLAPFLWTLITSLKPADDILRMPPKFIPWPPTLSNYVAVIEAGFPRYLLNSVIVAACTVIVVVVVAVHAGYAVARYEFRGKSLMMFVILAGMAMGEFSTALPLYFFGSKLHILDTYFVLVLANSAFIAPLAIWFLQGFFRSIPPQLEEAALMDGTTRLGALYRVVLPSALPGLVTVALISFVASWNEFILALVLTSSGTMRTAPVGIHLFMTDYGVQWGSLHRCRHPLDPAGADPLPAAPALLHPRPHGGSYHRLLASLSLFPGRGRRTAALLRLAAVPLVSRAQSDRLWREFSVAWSLSAEGA